MFLEGGLKKGTFGVFFLLSIPQRNICPPVAPPQDFQVKNLPNALILVKLYFAFIGLVRFIICLLGVIFYPRIHLLDNFGFLKEVCPETGCKYMVTLL